jgi:pimeloyl-ACP methyl ester carboxylesterase
VKERAVTFGPEGGLFGILHEPDTSNDLPAVLLLNAGLVHRVGPCRMSVDLARRLASLGFASLRFDLSGVGDSAPRPDLPDLPKRILADVANAMDLVEQRRGARRFVVAGMGSGAINAHRAAAADPRVVGFVMLDGYAYPTYQFTLRRCGSRLLNAASAISFVSRQLASIIHSQPAPPSAADDEILSQDFPPQERIAGELRQMMERNVSLLMVFSGSWHLSFNYPEQIRDNFPDVPFGDRLTVEHFPEADHAYTLLQDRERLTSRVLAWMQSRFC